MKFRWTSQAEQDRADIMVYIAADNVRAAIAMDELFGSTAARLADFPMLGKQDRSPVRANCSRTRTIA